VAPKQRVAVYVTRASATGLELLVFDHRDFPEAGTQIPAGGLKAGESIEDGALREVREEAGLSEAVVQATLGRQRRPHPHTGESSETTFVHASTSTAISRWTHHVTGDGTDAGLVFECYFVPLATAIGMLPDGQDEFLQSIQ
jgi:8-oxo-dGTP pyrophosphatase MutT (NUDIX family)